MVTKSNYKLTESDFRQINIRNLFFNQLGWNYERMQSSGYLWTILPQLRKMYGDNTDNLKDMMIMHNQFFNTSPFFTTIITGIDLAIEENEGSSSKETITGIKSGLMGPFAAIGDAIFGSLIPAIMGAIAATLAKEGSAAGIVLWIFVSILLLVFRWVQLKFAYREGVILVTKMHHKLNALTNAATLLGVFIVGALSATMINTKIIYTKEIGGVVINIQDKLDLILPRLVPLCIVGAIYWLLGRKNMNSTRAIFIVLFVAVLLSSLGILGK